MPITRNKRKRKIRSIRKTRGRKIKRNYRKKKLSRKNKKSKKSRRKKMKKKTKTKKRNRRGKGLFDDFLKSLRKNPNNQVLPQLPAPEKEGVAEVECKLCLEPLDTKKEKNLVQFKCINNCIFHKECLNKWCEKVYEMRKEESLEQCPYCASKIDYKCPNNNNRNFIASLRNTWRGLRRGETRSTRASQDNRRGNDNNDNSSSRSLQRMNAFDEDYYNLMYNRFDAHDY